MKFLKRKPTAPRLKVDIIGRTIGYGKKRPAVRYTDEHGDVRFIVHGSMERVQQNLDRFYRIAPYCQAVWYDEKTHEWEPAS